MKSGSPKKGKEATGGSAPKLTEADQAKLGDTSAKRAKFDDDIDKIEERDEEHDEIDDEA